MGGRFWVETLGCKANTYDSWILQSQLERRGWRRAAPGEPAELVIVNSCTVTNEADRQSRKAASRLARKHPKGRVVMTGCGAEVTPKKMAAVPGVDHVAGNQDKHALVEEVLKLIDGETSESPIVLGEVQPYARFNNKHPSDRKWPDPEDAFQTPETRQGRTRAFLKIQEGCDAFCTFCIIPYARGPARSLRPISLVQQVRELCAEGVREIVLTGTALGDYGVDLSAESEAHRPTLEMLIEMILRETPIEGLRIGSLDPNEVTDGILEIMSAEPRLRPHIHLSLQSPHPEVLKRMKRRYGADDAVDTLASIARVGDRLTRQRGLAGGVYVGMDVIVGFPGETEEIFRWSVERLKTLPWNRLHVFPYSEREGTAATRLDGEVDPAVRKERVRTLMALSGERGLMHAEALITSGQPLDVLMEGPWRDKEGWFTGISRNYHRVAIPLQNDLRPNTEISVIAEHATMNRISGDVILLGKPLRVHNQ